VAAAIGTGGLRVRPRIAADAPPQARRVAPAAVVAEVAAMMRAVVASGTGTAAQIPGVTVAGKTGTAELTSAAPTAPSNPKDSDAWFVAYAPAERPTIAVAVLLVRAGFGGDTAAPVARQVLRAALGR
jgi:cell division protein FtsI/penicillin-binding protein 2